MLEKTKSLAQKLLPHQEELTPKDVAAARQYIKTYWDKLVRFHPEDDESLLGLPKPYLVPAFDSSQEHVFNELYYWDSFFMVQSIMDEEHKELVLGILEDLLYMQKRLKIIPNASRTYLTGRSQPPLLTTFIFEVYDTYDMDKKWLKKTMDVAKDEYLRVWMGTQKPNTRRVYKDLSRYYDINLLHDLAEAESGWDMTPRFGRKALSFLPVDLNALLYKYELDFARAAHIFEDIEEGKAWEEKAKYRAKTMNTLMWNKLKGLFYDFNYKKEKRGGVSSLAAYYPMWVGMASNKQAKDLVRALKRFENRGGLAATDVQQFAQFVPGAMPTQWAYPNGWAPLHFIVVQALENYGYREDARRIAHKWLRTNTEWFKEHGVFLEKYNVVKTQDPPAEGLYPSPTGFGWTNAVFEYFCKNYIDE